MEFQIGIATVASFPMFRTALEYVFELARHIALVINGYPYFARASKSLALALQILIDKNKDTF